MSSLHFPALFQDRHALVLGLGDSGLAMAAWAARLGARVTVWDSREQPPQLPALRERLPDAAFEYGDFSPELLGAIDHSWGAAEEPRPVAAGCAPEAAARAGGGDRPARAR
ncbi:hypothetical protein ACFJIX_01200 [Roseateles sp. UC29_93]|uniref:hypothetical protein n=1 Tax=Roseateles sp. UC29_93 TaxID=3350177 RepID=UPI003672F4BC